MEREEFRGEKPNVEKGGRETFLPEIFIYIFQIGETLVEFLRDKK
jgi:hypothetical protein